VGPRKRYLTGDSVVDFIIILMKLGAWLLVIIAGALFVILEVPTHVALLPIWLPLHFILRRKGRKGFIWRIGGGLPHFYILAPARAFEIKEER
jgi:hypothetical protein